MRTILKWVWSTIKVFHVLVGTLFFTLLLIAIVGVLSSKPDGSVRPIDGDVALVLDLDGQLVETRTRIDPANYFANPLVSELPDEVLMRDVLHALETAKTDERVAAVILRLEDFDGGMPAQLHRLGAALDAFKASGKPVVAAGDSYSQSQYLVAAHANTVLMNSAGSIILPGYSRYQLYQKEALEKLKAKVHIFRVGEYKSAVEPFIRETMSPEARQANDAFLSVLWNAYLDAVSTNRGIEREKLAAALNDPSALYQAEGGDSAAVAKTLGLVDELVPQPAMEAAVAKLVGAAGRRDGSVRGVGYERYLKAEDYDPTVATNSPSVGVVTARGQIVNGEAGAQISASDSVSTLLRRARNDDDIKAVVFRIDSPGGSVFASEKIRQEMLALKASGKPVVASYAGVAASGAVWISAQADRIYAEATTVTGSIGVFSLFISFEDGAKALGLNVDGLGTTDLAGFSPLQPLPEAWQRLLKASAEGNYDQFLNIVADGRGLTKAEVDPVAQGRVWAGSQAADVDLIDGLGGIETAIDAAASLAEIDDPAVRYIERKPSQFESFLADLLHNAGLRPVAAGWQATGPLAPLADTLGRHWRLLQNLDDPEHSYALCETCRIR